MAVYGERVGRDPSMGPVGVVGELTTSMAGNVILRAGNVMLPGSGWEQAAHVVLTPAEARDLAHELERMADIGERSAR